MNERQARQVALTQVLDTGNHPLWTDADSRWASEAATRKSRMSAEALQADPGARAQWLAVRAELVTERLRERGTDAAHWAGGNEYGTLVGMSLVLIAFAAGALADSLMAGDRLNLLSPPFLAVIAWNVATYLGLFIAGIRRAQPSERRWFGSTWLLRAINAGAPAEPLAQQFRALWMANAGELWRARAMIWLHLAAAMFAIGLVASLYWRGLSIEYLASWSSTFLGPAQVSSVLHTILGPASLITGIGLPDTNGIAALAQSAGPGENAAPWIHLFAATLALIVIGPRLALAGWHAWRRARLVNNFPWPVDSDAVMQILPVAHASGQGLIVLPYGYTLQPDAGEALVRGLDASVTNVTILPGWQLGDEDSETLPENASAQRVVMVFNLSATPESEHHLRAAETVHAQSGRVPLVIVDESRFLARFASDEERLRQRRQAWHKLFGALCTPVFASLNSASVSEIRLAINQRDAQTGTTSHDPAMAS